MNKLPFPALLAAVLVTGIYGWLRQPPTQELAGMFIVSSALLSGIYYLSKRGWRRWARKPPEVVDQTPSGAGQR
jgi:hypothetical protein